MRLARGDTLVVASHNLGKLREIRELLRLARKGIGELVLLQKQACP